MTTGTASASEGRIPFWRNVKVIGVIAQVAFVLLLVLLVSACGFRLREPLTLPPGLAGVQIVSRDPYSPLAQALTRSFERAGLDVPETRGPEVALLRILSESWDSQAISVDQFGRAQEFTLRYAVGRPTAVSALRVLLIQQIRQLL